MNMKTKPCNFNCPKVLLTTRQSIHSTHMRSWVIERPSKIVRGHRVQNYPRPPILFGTGFALVLFKRCESVADNSPQSSKHCNHYFRAAQAPAKLLVEIGCVSNQSDFFSRAGRQIKPPAESRRLNTSCIRLA